MGYLLRLVILVVLAWLAYRLVRRLWDRDADPVARDNRKQVEMVPCEKCGVHIPRNEALMRGGKAYCSTAHLEADKQ